MTKKGSRSVIFVGLISFVCINLSAGTYYFKFDYGMGMNKSEQSICFYQIVENSGVTSNKQPLSISNGHIEILDLRKKKVKEIIFSGYLIDSKDNKRRSFLSVSKPIHTLNTGQKRINSILIIAATEEDDNFTPVAELLRILNNQEYNNILNKNKDEKFGYNNTFPIGRFILYNPRENKSKDVLEIPSLKPPFVQNSRSISDHYILRKQLGVNLDLGYSRLNVASETDKQQYIEYLVQIDTLEILNWNGERSEMQFLYDKVNSGGLDFLQSEIERDSTLKLYFVSSCVKVKNFKIKSQVFDSIAIANSIDIEVPAKATDLTIRAEVLYARFEGTQNVDETHIYYTGFRVRDYTPNVRDYFKKNTLQTRIYNAKIELDGAENDLRQFFDDFRKIDSSITDFDNTTMIVRFFEEVGPRDYRSISDTISSEKNRELEKENKEIEDYNLALSIFKEIIVEFKNKKNYLEELKQIDLEKITTIIEAVQPKEIKIGDEIIENALFVE